MTAPAAAIERATVVSSVSGVATPEARDSGHLAVGAACRFRETSGPGRSARHSAPGQSNGQDHSCCDGQADDDEREERAVHVSDFLLSYRGPVCWRVSCVRKPE